MSDIEDVIRQKTDEWLRNGITSAQEINSGWCADFTMSVFESLDDHEVEVEGIYEASDLRRFGVNSKALEKAASMDLLGHTFLVKVNHYYDAEAPAGVAHPLLLPIFTRALGEGRELNLINEHTYGRSLAYIADLEQTNNEKVSNMQSIDVAINASFQVIDGSGQTVTVSDQFNATVDLQHWLTDCTKELNHYCETKAWLKDKRLLNSVIFSVVATTEDGRYVPLMKEGYPDLVAAKSLERPLNEVNDPLVEGKGVQGTKLQAG